MHATLSSRDKKGSQEYLQPCEITWTILIIEGCVFPFARESGRSFDAYITISSSRLSRKVSIFLRIADWIHISIRGALLPPQSLLLGQRTGLHTERIPYERARPRPAILVVSAFCEPAISTELDRCRRCIVTRADRLVRPWAGVDA